MEITTRSEREQSLFLHAPSIKEWKFLHQLKNIHDIISVWFHSSKNSHYYMGKGNKFLVFLYGKPSFVRFSQSLHISNNCFLPS